MYTTMWLQFRANFNGFCYYCQQVQLRRQPRLVERFPSKSILTVQLIFHFYLYCQSVIMYSQLAKNFQRA